MANTRQNICDKAILLFNEKGYSNVSLREIAAAADTTIGNLTYYFKKKDDLVIEIVSDLLDDYSKNIIYDLHGEKNLKNLFITFCKSERNHKKYNFFFKNMNAITSNSEYFFNMNKDFQKVLYNYHLLSLYDLQKDGIIKSIFSPQALENIAFSVTLLISNWTEMGGPGSIVEFSKFSLVDCLVDLIKPYLEEKYIPELENLQKNKDKMLV